MLSVSDLELGLITTELGISLSVCDDGRTLGSGGERILSSKSIVVRSSGYTDASIELIDVDSVSVFKSSIPCLSLTSSTSAASVLISAVIDMIHWLSVTAVGRIKVKSDAVFFMHFLPVIVVS